MKETASIIPLDEGANLYLILDEVGREMGTGTKEVCEVLVSLAVRAKTPTRDMFGVRRSRENIRSAISI